MTKIIIKKLELSDESEFLAAMQNSISLHHPWVQPPTTTEGFHEYFKKYQEANRVCYLVWDDLGHLIGVFNVSEIVLGVFRSAYLGYFGVKAYEAKGYMSAALKLVLEQIFTSLGLHRIEANIQPNNIASLHLARANGFKKEGYSPRYLKVDGEWCDHERWAITYEDWSRL